MALLLTVLALLAFASNSIFARLALGSRRIDAGSFTLIRLASGAILLNLLSWRRHQNPPRIFHPWLSALSLFGYAAPFSFAYLKLEAGSGALILFGAVQGTMIGWDLFQGKRFRSLEFAGLCLAVGGLVFLTLPGNPRAPDLSGVALMLLAGVSWGIYSLLGRRTPDPLPTTAANFLTSLLPAAPLLLMAAPHGFVSAQGILLAIASGAFASGLGYTLWYAALRGLSSTRAALVQLLVPVLAAWGGVLFLGESLSWRLVSSGGILMAGVALAVHSSRGHPQTFLK